MTELRLLLDHAEAALKQAILDHLKMREDALLESQPGHRIQVCCKSAGLLLAQMGFKSITEVSRFFYEPMIQFYGILD